MNKPKNILILWSYLMKMLIGSCAATPSTMVRM